jgi:hypothetical protein
MTFSILAVLLCWMLLILNVTNNPFMLSVITLNVIMLSVVMLNAIMLSVVVSLGF